MTKENIGNKESSTESRLKEFEEKLDILLANLIIPSPKVSNNIDEIIGLSYDQLVKISAEECSIFSYQLKQYAYYIQQKENRYRNIERWANECLKRVYGKESSNYGTQYTKYEEKMYMIINGNLYADKLHRIMLEYGAYANELHLLNNKLLDMSKSLQDIKYTQRIKDE